MSKFGMFWCFVAGLGFAALLVGFPIAFSAGGSGGAYIAVGVNVWWLSALVGYGLLAARAAQTQQRAMAGTEVLRTALARIETSRASGEAPKFFIRMGLTIAPEGLPAFRADATVAVNLMEVDAYRVGKLLVVTYDETRPWRVTVVKNPTPEWSDRAAHGAVDSAPWETRVEEPRSAVVARRRWGRAGSMSMLAGLVVGLGFFIATHRW
jgi:hypothetical protein